MFRLFLADLVTAFHLGYVLFVVAGFILIVIGMYLKWRWTRNLWFRLAHLSAIVGVAIEALMGITCPLTLLEIKLRYNSPLYEGETSFLGSIMRSMLYYDAPEWLFIVIYSAFAVTVTATFVLVPPTRKKGSFNRHQD